MGDGFRGRLDQSSELWIWGVNTSGIFGDGKESFIDQPQKAEANAAFSDMILDSRGSMLCVLMKNKRVGGWGNAGYGYLGAGVEEYRDEFQYAQNLSGITSVSIGGISCACSGRGPLCLGMGG